jgi:predicted nuclease of restriction endonuclease-like (RecB) superfamily
LRQSKRAEDREFYVSLVAEQRWGMCKLERQVKLALFERAILAPPNSP